MSKTTFKTFMLQENTQREQIKQPSFSAHVNWHGNMEQKSSCYMLEELTESTHEDFILHNTQRPVFSSQLQDY